MLSIILSVQHLKGTSKKTGNDYDFYQLHCATRERRFGEPDLLAARTINVGALPSDFTFFPALYDLSFNSQGSLEQATLISTSSADFDTLFFNPQSSSPKK